MKNIAILILTLLLNSCSKNTDPRDIFTGNFKFYIEMDSFVTTGGTPGNPIITNFSRTAATTGSITKGDSSHQLRVIWGNNNIKKDATLSSILNLNSSLTSFNVKHANPTRIHTPYLSKDNIIFRDDLGGNFFLINGIRN